ncbi:B3 domain-containing protein, partial [Striga hermonthica]
YLPPGIKWVIEDFLPLECTLQNNECDDAFKWPVVVKRFGSKIGFADGWEEFARDHHLEENEQMCFELQGPNTFMVYHFNIGCCRKATRTVIGSCISDDERSVDDDEMFDGCFSIQTSLTLVTRGRQ